MKNNIKTLIATLIVCVLITGCPPGPDGPITPGLSQSSVTIEEGKTAEVTITKGIPPYNVTVSSSIATATVSDHKITIKAISAGSAKITVQGADLGSSTINLTITADPYKAFKADATLRFEGAGITTVKNIDAKQLFYSDKGGLYASTKNKLGYASVDGSSYYFVEWSGDAGVGNKTNPSLRTQNGEVALQSLQIVKSEGGALWVVYKQNASSAEGRIVQKW